MAVREFSYKGKNVKVDQPDDQHADVTIGRRKFSFEQHGDPLPMWMCDESYFGSPDLDETIRHLIDYWYIVDDKDAQAPLPQGLGAHAGHSGGGKKKSGHEHGKGR